MGRNATFITLTIANGAAATEQFETLGYRVAAVISPAAWTAADFSFEVENGSGTFVKVTDAAGALLKITGVATAASEYMIMPEIGDALVSPRMMKVVSTNTASEADVNQGAARTVIVVLTPTE